MMALLSPISLDGHLLLLGGWGLWCALHSLLIANATLAFLEGRLGRWYRFHRLAYVIFSASTLIPLIHLTGRMDPTDVIVWDGLERLVPAAGLILAVALFIAGGLHFEASRFLGVHQLRSGNQPRLLSRVETLDETGILGWIRHPWYAGTFLLLWSRNLSGLWIQVNALLSIYLVVGTLLEERKLVRTFGEAYRDYQRRVSMFIPVKRLRKTRRPK